MRSRYACALLALTGCELLVGIESTSPQVALDVAAQPATIVVGGSASIEIEVHTDAPGGVLVALSELPVGVTSSEPILLADGERGAFVLTADASAPHGDHALQVTAALAGDEARTEVALRVRGRPGELDTSFAAGGALSGDAQLGTLNGIAVQADGKMIVCGDGATFLRRLLPSGEPDPTFASAGVFPYVGTCTDVAVLADGTIVAIVVTATARYALVPVDASGMARPQITPPGKSFDGLGLPFVKVSSLRALPEGGVLVGGTVMWNRQTGTEAIGGAWLLDGQLSPVAAFTDGVNGVAGFAGETTDINADTFGLDAVRRTDGSLLVLADLPSGGTWVLLDFLANGQVLPGAVYPEVAPGLHLAMGADDTVFTCSSFGSGLAVYVSDTHVAASSPLVVFETDARCDAIAAAPARTMLFAGTHLDRWVWGRADAVPALDASFVHEWQPPGTVGEVRRVARLPDGRWVLGGTYHIGGAPHWAILRVWD